MNCEFRKSAPLRMTERELHSSQNVLQPTHLLPAPQLPLETYSPPGSQVYGDSPGKNTGNGLPCSPPGDLPNPGIKLRSPTWLVDSLSSEPPENLGKNSRGRVKDKIFVLKYSLWSWKEANQWQQQQQNKVLTIENQNTTHWSQYEQSWISHIKHFMSYKKAINPVNKECVSYKIIQCKIISSIIVM